MKSAFGRDKNVEGVIVLRNSSDFNREYGNVNF